MCGIAGFVGKMHDDHREDRRLATLLGAIAHRGPDDLGQLAAGPVQLGMRRLSIVDLGGGHQPIWSEDGRYALVGNGEIYNAPELQQELEARGHHFRSHSDMESVLHLFEDLGPSALSRLNGMFAIAIYDRSRDRIFLARDRLGIKPLFVADTPDAIFFSSEIPGLRELLRTAAPGALELDPIALNDFLAHGYSAGRRTIWSGIRRLSPGAYRWIELGGSVGETPWWTLPSLTDPADRGSPHHGSFDDRTAEVAADEIAALLSDSVRLRTLGDVRPGTFLSGGLDSSAITALLAQSSSAPVASFTLSVDDPDLDEVHDAEETARTFGCEHFTDRLSSVSGSELSELFVRFGEPFADPSLLPTSRVSQLAARHVKFVLSGDGGDELFAGYAWLLREVALRQWPRSIRYPARWLSPLLRSGQDSEHAGVMGQILRTLGDLSARPCDSFLRRRSLATGRRRRTLLDPRWGNLGPTSLERYAHGTQRSDDRSLWLDLDRRFYLGGNILEKVDRASMMHSLEARVPFLDHRMVEAAARIPVSTHLGPSGRGKEVLRRAMQRILPEPLFQRPKRGFGLPVDRWLREQLSETVRDRLLGREFRELGILDPTATERLLDQHQAGITRTGHFIWALTSLATVLTEAPSRHETTPPHASATVG